mgnify:CR=1 FL=1
MVHTFYLMMKSHPKRKSGVLQTFTDSNKERAERRAHAALYDWHHHFPHWELKVVELPSGYAEREAVYDG